LAKLKSVERIGSEYLANCAVFDVWRHRVRLDGSVEHDIYALEMPDWVTVVAVRPDGDIVLIRQHRHGVHEVVLETPGGMVDQGESPERAAERELLEETGYTPKSLESLGWVHPNPAIQTNRIHLFLARDVTLTAAPSFDAHESVELVITSPSDVLAALRDGSVTHALSALALERAFSIHRELFVGMGTDVP
jgi:8-oxo-dGTP pyrophosphatase MutT (NUDIX family)